MKPLTETTYCLFSLSRKDEAFTTATFAEVKKWLVEQKKSGEPYLFAGMKPRRVRENSKLLFSFEGKVFGKATADTDVIPVLPKEQELRRKQGKHVYKHSIILKESSVNLLNNDVLKKRITQKIGKTFSRVFTYFTKEQYEAILEMAK